MHSQLESCWSSGVQSECNEPSAERKKRVSAPEVQPTWVVVVSQGEAYTLLHSGVLLVSASVCVFALSLFQEVEASGKCSTWKIDVKHRITRVENFRENYEFYTLGMPSQLKLS